MFNIFESPLFDVVQQQLQAEEVAHPDYFAHYDADAALAPGSGASASRLLHARENAPTPFLRAWCNALLTEFVSTAEAA